MSTRAPAPKKRLTEGQLMVLKRKAGKLAAKVTGPVPAPPPRGISVKSLPPGGRPERRSEPGPMSAPALRFGPITERELDIADAVFRRAITAFAESFVETMRKYPPLTPPDAAIANFARAVVSDPDLREDLRHGIESATLEAVQ